jgi:hypothetical protein
LRSGVRFDDQDGPVGSLRLHRELNPPSAAPDWSTTAGISAVLMTSWETLPPCGTKSA